MSAACPRAPSPSTVIRPTLHAAHHITLEHRAGTWCCCVRPVCCDPESRRLLSAPVGGERFVLGTLYEPAVLPPPCRGCLAPAWEARPLTQHWTSTTQASPLPRGCPPESPPNTRPDLASDHFSGFASLEGLQPFCAPGPLHGCLLWPECPCPLGNFLLGSH